MIDSYKFGSIVIDGKEYTNDAIIFPDKVLDGWWRKEGHCLNFKDLHEIFNVEPQLQVLVVGTGYFGLMRVSDEVKEVLKTKKINLVAQRTKKACNTFNELLGSKRRVVAAFHLTC